MNQIIAILVGTFGIGLAYFVCAMFKHGLCDMAKMFNLLIIIGSMVTGLYLCIHAVELAIKSLADGAWLGVAGILLLVFSVQQIIIMFRELFAKKVTPTKLEADH
jgi:ABC-type thiamin/hydroxymethylpyrimidine transport system permease subunit